MPPKWNKYTINTDSLPHLYLQEQEFKSENACELVIASIYLYHILIIDICV